MTLAKDLLLRAAARIETHGLARGYWYEPALAVPPNRCPACAVGSVSLELDPDQPNPFGLTGGRKELAEEAVGVLREHLGLGSPWKGTPYSQVVDWSDAHTANEVIAAMRDAAA